MGPLMQIIVEIHLPLRLLKILKPSFLPWKRESRSVAHKLHVMSTGVTVLHQSLEPLS